MCIIILFVFVLSCCDSLCIEATTTIPVAGGAFTYDKKKWTNDKKRYMATNCYAYALNMVKSPLNNQLFYYVSDNDYFRGIQPGDFSKTGTPNITKVKMTLNNVYSRVIEDMERIGYKVNKVGKKKIKKKVSNKKTYLLYVVTTKQKETSYEDVGGNAIINTADYHWYRQDKNGYWSHKRGFTKSVSQKDSLGKKIKNPQKAAKRYEEYYYFKDDLGRSSYICTITDYNGEGMYCAVKRK